MRMRIAIGVVLTVLAACGNPPTEPSLPPDPFADAGRDGLGCCSDTAIDVGGKYDHACAPSAGLTVLFATGDADGFVHDDKALYWVYRGSPNIVSRVTADGLPTIVHEVTDGERVNEVASTGSTLYWISGRYDKTSKLGARPLASGSPIVVDTRTSTDESGTHVAIAATTTQLFAATTRQLLRYPLDGAAPSVLLDISEGVIALEAKDDRVAFASYKGVHVVPATGGPRVTLTSEGDTSRPARIAVGEAHVYWGKGGGVVRAPTIGGVEEAVASKAGAFRVVDKRVYWVIGGASGEPSTISAMDEAFGPTSSLVTRPVAVLDFVVVGGRLLWMERQVDGTGFCIYRRDAAI